MSYKKEKDSHKGGRSAYLIEINIEIAVSFNTSDVSSNNY